LIFTKICDIIHLLVLVLFPKLLGYYKEITKNKPKSQTIMGILGRIETL